MSTNICKTSQALYSTLPTVATFGNSSRRIWSIWFYKWIYKSHPWIYLIDNFFSSTSTMNWSSKPILTWICYLNSMLLVFSFEKCKNWTKKLLIIQLGIRSLNNCYGIKRFFSILSLPKLFPTCWYFAHLIFKVIIKILSCKRAHLSIRVFRISVLNCF